MFSTLSPNLYIIYRKNGHLGNLLVTGFPLDPRAEPRLSLSPSEEAQISTTEVLGGTSPLLVQKTLTDISSPVGFSHRACECAFLLCLHGPGTSPTQGSLPKT